MTHKYERVCWYCGRKDIEPDDRGIRCKSCGATWNEILDIDTLPGRGKKVVLRTAEGEKVTTSASPSTSSIRQAVRIRDGKSK